jgi:hypothetical protein
MSLPSIPFDSTVHSVPPNIERRRLHQQGQQSANANLMNHDAIVSAIRDARLDPLREGELNRYLRTLLGLGPPTTKSPFLLQALMFNPLSSDQADALYERLLELTSHPTLPDPPGSAGAYGLIRLEGESQEQLMWRAARQGRVDL